MCIYTRYVFNNSNMRILPSIWLQSGWIPSLVMMCKIFTEGKISCVKIDQSLMPLFNNSLTSQWLVVGCFITWATISVSWKIWCKIIVFSSRTFLLCCVIFYHAVYVVMGMYVVMGSMRHLWQVYECDSCDCSLFKVVINTKVVIKQNLALAHYIIFCWQNSKKMLRHCLRWTCIICEEIGKRFCTSKANFLWLRTVTVCTCLVYPGFSYIGEHTLIIWELPGIRFCSTALYPFVQMSFRVAALPFLSWFIPRLVQLGYTVSQND